MMLRGRYQIENQLGVGAHGTVYRGLDLETNTPIAIKQLRPDVVQRAPDLLKRFQREAEALRRLNHPNIVQVFDAFPEGSDHYIVMEYLPGGSLQNLRRQTPSLEHVLKIMLDLSDALIRAHRLDIIHRDLKPANVMLASDGTPRLSDFGVALMRDQERLTDTRGIVGTWAYMAPEVINGDPYDARADIWSFGVMLYELLAGRRPFDDSTMTGLIVAILTQPPADLEALRPDLPPALIDLVYRMLDKMPQARLSSMRRVGAELEAILQRLMSGDAFTTMAASVSRIPETDKPGLKRKHKLPAQTTPFIGREWEMEELLRLLQPSATSAPRLVTIVAPGGMGKSRLSLEVAQTLLEAPANRGSYPDGLYFVPLAPVVSFERLPQAIAEVVGYVMQNDGREPLQQLEMFLTERRLLLILDNFEHLTDGTWMIARLLEAASGLTILITSRERLSLSAELIFPLEGLRTPSAQATAPLEYSAVRLFVQSAQRVSPQFSLQPQDVPYVAAICRLVNGLPLGLMLAATWAELLTPQEIAGELSKSADFLAANMQDLPERHRSMRAVFEYSWQRLTVSEQNILAQLSIFRGPFSRAAAQAVTGASLRELLQLVNNSLLHRDRDTGYYDLHELIRQFAESHLKRNEADYQAALEAHSHYYCFWLKDLTAIMQTTQVEGFKAMDAELDNIRQAWQHAVLQKNVACIAGAEETFEVYCRLRGLTHEIVSLFHNCVLILEALPATPERDRTLACLYSRQSYAYPYPPILSKDLVQRNIEQAVLLLRNLNDEINLSLALFRLAQFWWSYDGEETKINNLAQESLTLAQRHQFLPYQALIEIWYAHRAQTLNEKHYGEGLAWSERALAHYQQIGHPEGQGDSLMSLGICYWLNDEPQRALKITHSAMPYYEMIDDWEDIVNCLNQQSLIYSYIGDYETARQIMRNVLDILATRGLLFIRKMSSYRSLGHFHYYEGHYDLALEYFAEALKHAHLPGISSLAPLFIALNKAAVFIRLNRLDEAETLLLEAEKAAEQLWQYAKSAYLYSMELRGQWYCARGHLMEAKMQYIQTLKKSLEIDDSLSYVRELLIDLAEVWQRQGNYSKAAAASKLMQNTKFMSMYTKKQINSLLDVVRPHLSDEQWAQIEAEAAATTLEEYAKRLIQEAGL